MVSDQSVSQKGIILVDDVTYEPILDFNTYSDIIVNIVNNSYPKFSLGIYGEWGTGKTTLMKIIQNKLDKTDEILTVWFNAWRYERGSICHCGSTQDNSVCNGRT